MVTYARGRRIIILVIITLFSNCKISITYIYLIKNVSADTLATGWMIPARTNSPPAEEAT